MPGWVRAGGARLLSGAGAPDGFALGCRSIRWVRPRAPGRPLSRPCADPSARRSPSFSRRGARAGGPAAGARSTGPAQGGSHGGQRALPRRVARAGEGCRPAAPVPAGRLARPEIGNGGGPLAGVARVRAFIACIAHEPAAVLSRPRPEPSTGGVPPGRCTIRRGWTGGKALCAGGHTAPRSGRGAISMAFAGRPERAAGTFRQGFAMMRVLGFTGWGWGLAWGGRRGWNRFGRDGACWQ